MSHFTREDLQDLIDGMYRVRPEPSEWPKQYVDWDKLVQHKIRLGFDSYAGIWMTSGSEMRRAIAVGAVWYDNGPR